MKIFLPGPVCSQPKSQRSLGDLISLCKREAVPPGPRRSCQAQTWPAPGSPSSTCHARRPPFRGGGPFSPSVRPGSRGSGTREALAAASLPAPLHPAPRRGSPAHPPRLRQSKARAGATGSARRPRPPASLWPAAFPASSAALGRAGRSVWRSSGRGRLAAGHHSSAPRPSAPWTASAMDFEDGERGARGGPPRRAGGGRPAPGVCLPPQDGRVALFCGPRGAGGPGPGPCPPRLCGRPGRPPPAAPPPPPAGSASLRAPRASGLRPQPRPGAACNFPALRGGGGPGPAGPRPAGGRVEPSLLTARPGLGRPSASPREASVKRSIGVGFIHPPAPQSPPPSRNLQVLTPRSRPGCLITHPRLPAWKYLVWSSSVHQGTFFF